MMPRTRLAKVPIITGEISDSAVTLAKVTNEVKSVHVLGDDTEVTETSTTWVDKKIFRFNKDTGIASLNWKVMEVMVEGKVAAAGQTTEVGFFIGTEVTPRVSFSFVGTVYTLSWAKFSIADLPTGLHLIRIAQRVAAAGHTGYQRHVEVKAVLT